MQVYIVQNEKDEICYVSIDPIDVLEEIERMNKTTLTVGIWPLGDLQKTNETYEEIKAKTVTTKWPTYAKPSPDCSNYKFQPDEITSCESNKDFLTETKSTEL